MTKKEKKALAYQAFENAIDGFAYAMRTAFIAYIAETGRKTHRIESAWETYVEACKRLVELGD